MEMTVNEMLREYGFCFREPKTSFQKFVFYGFRKSAWARKLLGGKWQSFIHDIGTSHAIITWHWVDDFIYRDLTTPTFRTEDHSKIIKTNKEQV